VIGSRHDVAITYRRPVSYGIRRCEFDHYLLERSRARLHLGATVAGIRKEGAQWVVNERIKAPLLVGAGGHFCPVARMLNPGIENGPVVVAREAEFPIEAARAGEFAIEPDTPELYFCADLKGYGWGFGKQGYLNLGLGRLDRREAPAAARAFLDYLRARRKITSGSTGTWRGHAYLLSDSRRRQIVADGVMLLGDAAGLAYPHSGEGIRPAVESGLLAASTIVESGRSFSFDRLRRYQERLGERFGPPATAREPQSPSRVALTAALGLLHVPWFVRHVVLDRWFLRAAEPALPH
jgi:flavin-dependent dehydrogenase